MKFLCCFYCKLQLTCFFSLNGHLFFYFNQWHTWNQNVISFSRSEFSVNGFHFNVVFSGCPQKLISTSQCYYYYCCCIVNFWIMLLCNVCWLLECISTLHWINFYLKWSWMHFTSKLFFFCKLCWLLQKRGIGCVLDIESLITTW